MGEEIKSELEKLRSRVEELEKENRELKEGSGPDKSGEISRDKRLEENVSRRDFLKKLGLGAAGLGVLGLGPVSALSVRGDSLDVFTQNMGGTKTFSVGNGGDVELLNGNFNMNNNNLTQVDYINSQDASSLGGISKDKSKKIALVNNFIGV